MKLFTIGEILDSNIGVIIIRINRNDDKNGYNFQTKCFADDYKFSPEKVITMKEFRNTSLYETLKSKELESFYIIKTDVVQALNEVSVKENKVVVFEVLTGPSDKAIRRAINVASNIPNPNGNKGFFTKNTYHKNRGAK